MQTKIGFIGQGWIGKHYADEFENRLYAVVRYALEEPYVQNKDQIKECQVVFLAVPTPTTSAGFSYEPVRSALGAVGSGSTVVIKSTLIPGTTEALQAEFPNLFILHSPEFLVEATAAHDAAKPLRNIVGIPIDTDVFRAKAEQVLKILPEAPYNQIMSSREAEIVKYAGNGFLFTKVIFFNLLYDFVAQHGGDWEMVRQAITYDPRIASSHTNPIHRSGHDTETNGTAKRGAGGHCFIKDFEALRRQYAELLPKDATGQAVLASLIDKNIELLTASNKDLDLLEGVYGKK